MTDHSAERAVLEHIAQDRDWAIKNASQLSPLIFSKESNRIVFEVICEMSDWDMMSVTRILNARGQLDKAGGAANVTDLFTAIAVPRMADYHLERAREDALLRRTLESLQQARDEVEAVIMQGGSEKVPELLNGVYEKLANAGRLPGKRLNRMTSAQAMEKAVNEIEERAKNPGQIRGITTGMATLDKLTHGLQQGHLWVIAGGPGDGKSALMQNLLEAAAGTGCKNAVYQLEMPIEEQALRFLASDSMTDSGNLMTGMMTHEESAAIAASIKRLKKWGTTFVDTDNASAEDILADIEAGDDRVVMVDYLQLLDVTQAKNESRELAISRVAKDLKRLAKRKGITILTGSQLNDDGKLRESRAIGQHADKVLFVQRVEVDDEPDMSRRALLLAKNRGGKPMERISLKFAGASFRFSEAPYEEPQEPDWTEKMRRKRR